MIILALETSSPVGSLSLIQDGQSLAGTQWSRDQSLADDNTFYIDQSHSEVVTEKIQDLLRSSSLKLDQIDLLATSIGPGSFTGIRVAINTIKSLSYTLDKPIAAFNSLELLAHTHPEDSRPLIVMINAYKNMVFYQKFTWSHESWQSLAQPHVVEIESLNTLVTGPHLTLGEGYPIYKKFFAPDVLERLEWSDQFGQYPTALCAGQMAWKGRDQLKTIDWKDLGALYIRPSSAEEKRESGLLKPIFKL